jgi:hypothetical protein
LETGLYDATVWQETSSPLSQAHLYVFRERDTNLLVEQFWGYWLSARIRKINLSHCGTKEAIFSGSE